MMELTTSWKEEGIQISLRQGRQEEAVSILPRLLRRRFGNLSTRAEAQIRRLELPQLEHLSEALLDFRKASDLTEWLRGQGRR